jgi:transcription initiation factor TFIIF subunit beta
MVEVKHLETTRADCSVWLMKCPTVVSRAWQDAATSAASSSSAADGTIPNPNPVVAKVVLYLDPLHDDQPLVGQRENGAPVGLDGYPYHCVRCK